MSARGEDGRDHPEGVDPEGSAGDQLELLRSRVSDYNIHGKRATAPEDREEQLLSALHELRVHQEELRTQNEELLLAQQAVEESQRRYQHLFEYAPVGYLTADNKGVVQEINLAGAEILRQPRGMFVGKPFALFLERRHRDRFNGHVREVFQGRRAALELEVAGKDGGPIPLEVESRPVLGAEGEVVQCWTVFRDISRRRQTEADAALAQRIIQNAHEGVMVTDPKGVIISVNPCFEKTTGYSAEEAIGQTANILHSGQHDEDFYREMWRAIGTDGHWQGEIWNRRKDGEIYPEWLNITAIRDADGRIGHYVGIFSDLSTHEAIRERLHHMAYYDSLTGLANRDLFFDRLKSIIARADRDNEMVALAFLDLDGFKLINDNLGHRIGDELLRQVADRLRTTLRGMDSIARMGGDEFTVLVPGITSVHDSTKVARKLLDALSQPFNLEGGSYHVYASIGISHYPDDGVTAEELLKHADVAMYCAKDKGRNTYQVFESEHKHRISERLRLENELRRALDNDEFEVHYQPQALVSGGGPVGLEALVRWRHPERGLLAPGEFITMAEENGLIVPIGQRVLATVCTQAGAWREAGLHDLRVALNLSPHQFLQGNLLDTIDTALAEAGLPASVLELEITESAAMPNLDYSVAVLEGLREMGVRVALDDFGTGFSSLAHLKRLPLNAVKIDRSFVQDVPHDPDNTAITRTIISMADTLGLEVVAEGVENDAQLGFLREHGCILYQGFLLGRPVPASELSTLLTRS